jgi:hypothetical protein
MFSGSQSHAFSCEHATHDLLTLISLYGKNWKKTMKNKKLRIGLKGGGKIKKKIEK